MDVLIGGKRVRLQAQDALGSGGEATITRCGPYAVKVYHQPNPHRGEKLKHFISKVTPALPPEVVAPIELAYHPTTQAVVGFTMAVLDPGYEVVAALARRSRRQAVGLGTKFVAETFVAAHKTLSLIHQAGAVVGDLNDLNELYTPAKSHLVWIDVDSFQVGPFPCEVATETFLDPLLYGPDIAHPVLTGGTHRQFRPEHDWYSFAVMLFRSLTLVHPYGGVDKTLPTIPRRAQAGRSVFSPGVLYPSKVGYALEILSESLTNTFKGIFEQRGRGTFPVDALTSYVQALGTCKSCGAEYPSDRNRCPICAAAAPVSPVQVKSEYDVTDLIVAQGEVLALCANGDSLICLAIEAGRLCLYRYRDGASVRTVLGPNPGSVDLDLGPNHLLVASRTGDPRLVILAHSGMHREHSTTERFGGQQAAIGCSHDHYYRIAGGMLLRGAVRGTSVDERAVTSVAADQTWISVSKQLHQVGDILLGCFRAFRDRFYFLVVGPNRVDLDRAATDTTQTILDETVLFSDKLVALLRLVQVGGVQSVDTRIFDHSGKRLACYLEPISDRVAGGVIHGGAFAGRSLLFATDHGVVRERFDETVGQNPVEKRTLAATEPFVASESEIVPFQRGLAVTHGSKVRLLKTR